MCVIAVLLVVVLVVVVVVVCGFKKLITHGKMTMLAKFQQKSTHRLVKSSTGGFTPSDAPPSNLCSMSCSKISPP